MTTVLCVGLIYALIQIHLLKVREDRFKQLIIALEAVAASITKDATV